MLTPVPLLDLWMPILASAVAVFLVSSVVHMALNWHASDYRGLANEDEVRALLRRVGVTRGAYHFPHCKSMKEMGTPEMVAKMTEGPVGHLVINPSGPPAMGKYLGSWFAYCVLVSVFVAYLAGHTMAVGTPYLSVFRVTGTAAFLAYGLSQLVDSIWKGQMFSATIKHVVDGLLYALVTAGCFGWLWPN
jgi:hypothetical protein